MAFKLSKKELLQINHSLARWKEEGGKLTSYQCPHCEGFVVVRQPSRSDLGKGRRCWDSARVCTLCWKVSFVGVWPSGKTKAHKLGG